MTDTTAVTAWPHRSSGQPTTVTSRIGAMSPERLLDLLGEDLLATGVDRDRVAFAEGERAVRAGSHPVAGHGVAHAVHLGERLGRLRRVAEVAPRHPTRLGEPPPFVLVGTEHPTPVLRQHDRRLGPLEVPSDLGRRRARSGALIAGFARPEEVDDPESRNRLEEARLGIRREDRTPGEQEPERGQVVAAARLQLSQEGLRERIAHDQQGRDPVAFDRVEHVGGVEPSRVVLDHHGGAPDPSRQHVPVRGTVHERRGRQHGQRPALRVGQQRVEVVADRERRVEEVALTPQGALGLPGRSAGVEHVVVLGRRLDGGDRRGCPIDRLRVGEGTRQQRLVGLVVDLEEQLEVLQVAAHLVDDGGVARRGRSAPSLGSRRGRGATRGRRSGS